MADLAQLQAQAARCMAADDYAAAEALYAKIIEAAPARPEGWEGVGRAYLAQGKREHAILVFSKLCADHAGRDAYVTLLARALQSYAMPVASPAFRQAIMQCLTHPNLYHDMVFHAWRRYLALAPEYAPLRACIDGASPTPGVLNDDFLCAGLRAFIVQDPALELFLTRMRAALLSPESGRDSYRPFLTALAQQCFMTEYAYARTAAELDKAADLPPHDYLMQACYMRVPAMPADSPLYREQVVDFATEESLRTQIETPNAIADGVSQKVRAQYEENPYPRWKGASSLSFVAFGADIGHLHKAGRPLRVLVAGCGTGRQVSYAAQYFPDAQITAVDLSRASLAFARRKGIELGYDSRVRYVQMDLLDLQALDQSFDIIFCTGVLHHMDDPMAGWRALCAVAAPGAVMRIALYSDIARQSVIAARGLIAREGFVHDADGIRACRTYILQRSGDPAYAPILASPDFYSLSGCRDLLFHVQEHRFTIPQIETCLRDLGLAFLKFHFTGDGVYRAYRARFADDAAMTNLAHWHAFEQDNPVLFQRMYQFTVRAPG